jgi:inosine-uridine nucleoside N-ribohydrolase
MTLGDVWLDFDPAALVTTGLDVDDDLAFLALLALQRRGRLNLVGVSVTAGNAALRDTLENAKRLLRLAGVDEEPVAGASYRDMYVPWPWVRRLHNVRGDVAGSSDAAEAIRSAVRARPPRSLTIIALGPLTNVAAALADAEVAGRVGRVVSMGGALDGGKLDLNWMSDRAAARAVLASRVPLTVAPVELCAQAAVQPEDVDRLVARCCPGAAVCSLARAMRRQCAFSRRFVNRGLVARVPDAHSALVCDAFVPWDVVAVLAVAEPELFGVWREFDVAVPPCVSGEPCGGTVVVRNGSSVLAPTRLSSDGVVDALVDLVCEVPAVGPAPGIVGAPVLFGSVAVAVLVPLLLLRGVVSKFRSKTS